MSKMNKQKFNWPIITLVACLAGILYCSWPLGYILNPSVTRHDFASELQASHQPYAWLFIATDILTGVLMLAIGIWQWKNTTQHKTLRLSIISYVLFGILVIAAAVAPYNCVSGSHSCQLLLHSPAFIIHGFSSIVSVVFLFVSLVLPGKILLEQRMYRWLIVMGVFLVGGWGLTGLGTIIVVSHGMRSNWMQYNFITICSISLVASVVLIERLGVRIAQVPPSENQID
jgi:hypothetical protein